MFGDKMKHINNRNSGSKRPAMSQLTVYSIFNEILRTFSSLNYLKQNLNIKLIFGEKIQKSYI